MEESDTHALPPDAETARIRDWQTALLGAKHIVESYRIMRDAVRSRPLTTQRLLDIVNAHSHVLRLHFPELSATELEFVLGKLLNGEWTVFSSEKDQLALIELLRNQLYQ